MKVAIIGAGLAGLACAHELEKYGISPVIYERNGFIGETHAHVTASLHIVNRPIRDVVRYLKKNFDIDLKPSNTINRLIHYSPRKKRMIKGNFGYFFVRGKGENSIKNQLYAQLNHTKVVFNHLADYEKLLKENDYVIAATGNSNFAEELGCFYEWVTTHLRGAVVLGDFDPNTLTAWINKEYCKSGYAYLTPIDKQRASLSLIVPEVIERDIEYYWERFLYAENINYTITEEFRWKHKTGYVYPNHIGNLYFAGKARGGIDPFLGFGQAKAVIEGVMAARAIVKGKDYGKLIKPNIKKNKNIYEFRKAYNHASNEDYDRLITFLSLPGIKQLIYYSPLNVVKTGGMLLGFMNRNRKSDRK